MEIKKVIGGVALGAVALELLKLATKSSSPGQPRTNVPDRSVTPSRKPEKKYLCKFCGKAFCSLWDMSVEKCSAPVGILQGAP